MNSRTYTATKTRSNRKGWSVTFRHPRRKDARGRFGLKVRRGLGTSDDAKADVLVEQLNELLSDQSWWALDRRGEATLQYDPIVVKAFFDNIETGKSRSRDHREDMLPMPGWEDGYARVMLVGSTGAGKTTLLRQLIGSDHKRDRFPSTSTAKTTTAEIEIITTQKGPFKAAVTFMTEYEVRGAVDECLEAACVSAVRGEDDQRIAGAILEHPEQRFRLSYPLGSWRQEPTKQQAPSDEDSDWMFDDLEDSTEELPEDEIVSGDEVTRNNTLLSEYVTRVKDVAQTVQRRVLPELGSLQDMKNAAGRQGWLERFTGALYDNQEFSQISLDIMDEVRQRFDLVNEGDFEGESTDWPSLWYYEESDRAAFLRHVRWFTGNHSQQFGRLLTPLVDGIRVSGSFQPAAAELVDDDRRLVLLDGEGLGHSAREATSISTKVTERFQDVDMILLIDNAQSPLQAAPLELLRSVGTGGHGHKLGVVFTHFDQVRGDNLRTYQQMVDHVYASVGNAMASLRESVGAPVIEILESNLANHNYYLGGLDRPTKGIPKKYVADIGDLLAAMQLSAVRTDPVDAAPNYDVVRLQLALRDATDGFKIPWWGILGLRYHEGVQKEHWARVKALCRRIANRWDNEYSDLRPVADLIRQLQNEISRWLDNPPGWTRQPADEAEEKAAISGIRQDVFQRIHELSERRLIEAHPSDWEAAYNFRGTGSSRERAGRMALIYEAAAPSVSSVLAPEMQEFLDEVIYAVKTAVEEANGTVHGAEI